jgi:nucleoside phosphorylase
MTWSVVRARQAAAQASAAPLGAEATATLRPRGVLGLARDRAPLPVLLWIAARDGLVAEQDNGGYAVLQRPFSDRAPNGGGYVLRALRRLDRQWSLAVFCGPALIGLLAAVAAASLAARDLGIAAIIASMLWICLFLTSMLVVQLRQVALMGAAAAHGQDGESLAFTHWSVRLIHQSDPDRIDDLMRLLTERMTDLIRADLQASAGDRARVGAPAVTETLVILTRGITTEAARAAVTRSPRAVPGYPSERGAVILASPTVPDRVPRRPLAGGGFLVTYAAGLAVVLGVCALFVSGAERAACLPGSCAGRPATYPAALRYLLQRLLFSDPSGLTPATTRVVVLGWLVSLASAMLVIVAVTAGRQEIARHQRAVADYDDAIDDVIGRGKVLILVVTEKERDAVLAAAYTRTGQDPVLDNAGERTIYRLGTIGGTEVVLAQAGEQGTATAAGMIITARASIAHSRPDYVILTGICYGLRPDEGQRLGHIIVARRVHNIDHRKVVDDESRPVIRRGVNVGCSPWLLDRFQAGQATWTGSRVHFGTVLTSNTLVNSRQLVCEMRKEFPDAIGGEMEGSGVYEATTLENRPDWIMVKAISDWGYTKAGGKQSLAARNATEFVIHVIASGALRHRPGTRLPGNSPAKGKQMPGYNPNCNNCFKCLTCKGDGTIMLARSDRGKAWRERVTCPTCKGVGGKPGAGAHDHR